MVAGPRGQCPQQQGRRPGDQSSRGQPVRVGGNRIHPTRPGGRPPECRRRSRSGGPVSGRPGPHHHVGAGRRTPVDRPDVVADDILTQRVRFRCPGPRTSTGSGPSISRQSGQPRQRCLRDRKAGGMRTVQAIRRDRCPARQQKPGPAYARWGGGRPQFAAPDGSAWSAPRWIRVPGYRVGGCGVRRVHWVPTRRGCRPRKPPAGAVVHLHRQVSRLTKRADVPPDRHLHPGRAGASGTSASTATASAAQ